MKKILISGAGVAGLALAYWLGRAGLAVTIVERAPALRRGGQAVDIRGVALDVVQAMGLLDDARALRTRLRGMSVLDADGNEIHRTEERTFSAGRLDSDDIEIFRDDLCALLMRALDERVQFLYDDSIAAVADTPEGADVTYASGATARFDLVVGADGVYSNVRKRCFNNEPAVVFPLGVILALFSVPNLIDLKDWEIGYRQDGVGYVIYPSRDQRDLRIGVGFGAPESGVSRTDVVAQKQLVASCCAFLKGDFPRFLAAMQASDQFYFNELAQIRMPSWSQGRVVLVGDAAHCASPFAGQGTSLALVGARVLAWALLRRGGAHGDTRADTHANWYADAFAVYESRMRPYVDLNQALVDLKREGPIPDAQMTAAKNGIDLTGML